ncbi:MAG: ABC transporter permease [Oscillospiraceae bacterium]|jgi:putative ABC transport system permease protein|nr:ABC transporter permease [Oscillospiraceae bacterium]
MNFKENIRIAIYSIRTNLMRSLLTMLGIIIGVFSVIAIITVGNGGRDYIVGMVRDMGQSMVSINVDPMRADASQYITREDVEKIKKLDDVQYVSPQIIGMGAASSETTEGFAIVISGDTDLRYILAAGVVEGHFFNEDEYQSAQRVCLIPKMGAKAMFGTTDVIRRYVDLTMNGQTAHLKIIGLVDIEMMGSSSDKFSDMLDSSGLMGGMSSAMTMLILPATLTDQMMGSEGAYDNVYIMANDESHLDIVGNAAANLLYIRHGNAGSKAYGVTNMATYIDLLDSVINILTTFIAGVSAISLVVGGIGVMNIMLVSVTERTREIGIRKALGAKTSTILMQFLTESVILCLIGGIIGFILGVAGAAVVAFYMNIPIAMKLRTIAIAIGFSSAIGIFFGIYPARRAAKMLPIDALRRD